MPLNPDEARVTKMKKLLDEIAKTARKTVEQAIQLGGLLTEHKQAIGHGGFMDWVKDELDLSHATATNYMRLYENRKDPKLLNVSNLTEAYGKLRGPQKRPTKKKKNPNASGRFDFSDEQSKTVDYLLTKITEALQGETFESIVLQALELLKERVDAESNPLKQRVA